MAESTDATTDALNSGTDTNDAQSSQSESATSSSLIIEEVAPDGTIRKKWGGTYEWNESLTDDELAVMVGDLVSEYFYEEDEPSENKKETVTTGLHHLDEVLGGGLYPGVTYLAGVPGSGKTALALQIYNTRRNMTANLPGALIPAFLFASLELTRSEIGKRLLTLNGIKTSKIDKNITRNQLQALHTEALARSNEENRTHCGIRDQDSFNFIYARKNAIREAYMRNEIQRADEYYDLLGWDDNKWDDEKKEYGDFNNQLVIRRCDVAILQNEIAKEKKQRCRVYKDLCVIDYLQLLQDDRYPKDDTGRISAASRDLVKLAKHTIADPCAVLCVSSMSRTGYTKPRELSSMAGSSSIEYDAECVMVLERDDDYKPGSEAEAAWMEQTGITRSNLTITKNRHGKTPVTIPLWFDGARGRFFEPKSLQDQPAK